MTVNFREFQQDPSVTQPINSADLTRWTVGSDDRGLYRDTFKRILDVTLVLLSAVVVVPVVTLLALLVASDGASSFYSQDRVGRNGRSFRIWKLRTMVPDADARLARHLAENPDAAAEWNRTQKLKRDPRITPIGRILRKTSMDELPQLWNVLVGEMSLVGPRPMMTNQQSLYPGAAYYRLRPGITGAWQVSERNESSFAERAVFDASYDQSVTLANDLSIILRTVRVVLRGTGY